MGGIRIFLRIIICCFGILSIIVIGFRSNNGICLIRCIICCAVLRSYCRICYCCISGFCWVLWWIGWNCCIWFRGISSLIINRNWNIWCRVWFWKNCVIFCCCVHCCFITYWNICNICRILTWYCFIAYGSIRWLNCWIICISSWFYCICLK